MRASAGCGSKIPGKSVKTCITQVSRMKIATMIQHGSCTFPGIYMLGTRLVVDYNRWL
jgi:hypothetical protein